MDFDLGKLVRDSFLANNQVLVLVGSELYAMQEAVSEAAKGLCNEKRQVDVLCHDPLASFHRPGFPLTGGGNAYREPLVALTAMMSSFADNRADLDDLVDDQGPLIVPENPMICVLKGWEGRLFPVGAGGLPNDLLVQAFRNTLSGNLCSPIYSNKDDDNGKPIVQRGSRLLVLLCATYVPNPLMPELKPIYVPLPDRQRLSGVATQAVRHIKGDADPDEAAEGIVRSLIGMTYQDADEAVALALVEHGGCVMPEMLGTIERRKALSISGINGLTYIPRERIEASERLPGYEALDEFLLDCMAISPEKAAEHSMSPLKGFLLVGRPGTGKTVASMMAAKRLRRPLVIWNIGESQGSLLGDSEANARKAIQICQSLEAFVLLDDFDKAGAGASATGGYQGDGGTFGRMIQMLLTEMALPTNKAVWAMTANVGQRIPPERSRAGRLDERFFVAAPNEGTRLSVLSYHILKRRFSLEGVPGVVGKKEDPKYHIEHLEKGLAQLASDSVTGDWTGSELEGLVVAAGRKAIRAGTFKLDGAWMVDTAKKTTPIDRKSVV